MPVNTQLCIDRLIEEVSQSLLATCEEKQFAHANCQLELERRSLVNANGVIFTPSDDSEGPCGSKIARVDLLAVAANFTNGGASLGRKYVSKPSMQ